MSNVAVDYQNGIFGGTNNLVEVIGNTAPMTVEDYVNANKEAFTKDGRFAITSPQPMLLKGEDKQLPCLWTFSVQFSRFPHEQLSRDGLGRERITYHAGHSGT